MWQLARQRGAEQYDVALTHAYLGKGALWRWRSASRDMWMPLARSRTGVQRHAHRAARQGPSTHSGAVPFSHSQNQCKVRAKKDHQQN